jgi:hypothetical protein
MVDYISEPVLEILGMLLYGLGAGTLAILGTVAEQSGMQFMMAGDTTLGLWAIGVGLIALYAGYFLTTDKLLPQMRALMR